jgi:CRP-like cAMP-binding protein
MDSDLLAQLPFFSELEPGEVEAIARSVDEVSVAADRDLVREGDFSYDVFVLVDGAAKVHRDGQEVAQLGPGDFFGESGVLGKGLRGATVTTTEPTRLVTLNHWDIQRLRKEIPQVLQRMEEAMEARGEA